MSKNKLPKRSNPGGDLLQFVVGVAMLAAGLFWLFNVVHVSIGVFGYGGWGFGGMDFSGGAIFVPFIACIIWMFIKPNLGAKICLALSVLLIIVAIIMSARITWAYMSLWQWLILLILICGGAALVAKQLFLGGTSKYEGTDFDLKK